MSKIPEFLSNGAKGIVSSIFTGLGSTISQSLFGRYRRREARKYYELADEYARRSFNRETAFSERMYERQVEDNSPVAMRARLEAAGLNPALYFANGAGSATGSSVLGASSPTASPEGLPDLPFFDPASQAESMASAGKLTNETPSSSDFRQQYAARTSNFIASALSSRSQAAFTNYQRYFSQLTQDLSVSQMRANISKCLRESDRILAETALTFRRYQTEFFNTKLADYTARQAVNALALQSVDFIEGLLRIKTAKYNLNYLLPQQVNLFRAQAYKALEEGFSEAGRRLLFGAQISELEGRVSTYPSQIRLNNARTGREDATTRYYNARTKWMPVMNISTIANDGLNTVNNIIRTFKWAPKGKSKSALVPTISSSDISEAFRLYNASQALTK